MSLKPAEIHTQVQENFVCDIVLLVFNNITLTKNCIESILNNTDVPSKLIIVDNGSEKNVRDQLSRVKGNDNVKVTIILNEKNLGFARGMNIGIRNSNSQFVCLLNNDTIVTPGWLNNMIEVGLKNPGIGVINPASNNFGQYPPKGKNLEAYSGELRKQFAGKYTEVGQCIGFCMLIKRELIEKIGLLDEEQGFMFFEDTDYCYRAKRAAFKCAIALGAYVYHHEHKSFGRIKGIDKIFKKSQEAFYKRWGKPQRVVLILSQRLEGEPNPIAYYARGIRDLLRDNHFVYIITMSRPTGETLDELGISHANLRFICYRKSFLLRCFLKILLRRKKRFDFIIARDSYILNILKKTVPIHKTAVLDKLDKKAIEAIWQKRFNYQS
jgi:GT2 family glycosyltransferase